MKKRTIYLILILILFFNFGNSFKIFSQSSDWLQWRGPFANSFSPETDWSPKSVLNENSKIWETNVGMGFSAPVIKGNRLFISGNFEKTDSTFFDRITCINTESGKEIWKYEYPCNEYEDPGPFSTPLYNEGYLYTLSREGHLHCFDAENGSILWKHNLIIEKITNEKDSSFLVASAPVVFQDLLILNLNKSGIAFNKKTGELVWNSEKTINNFNISTPVLFEFNNKKIMAIQTEHKTSGINPLTGEVYWEINSGSMPDPIISENCIYLFTVTSGFSKYQIKNDTLIKVWNNPDVKCQCQSYVVKDNYAYGFGPGKFQCISLKTGERKWWKKMKEGALIHANDILIILEQDGNLIFAETNPEEYTEVLSTKVITNPKTDQKGRGYRRASVCLTNPVLSYGKIYMRNSYGNLICVNASNE